MTSGSFLVLFNIEVERPQNSRGSNPNRFAHLFIRIRTDSLTFSSDLTVSLTCLSDLIDFGTERNRKMTIWGSIPVSKMPSGSSLSGKSHPCDPSNPPEIARKANLVKYLQFCCSGVVFSSPLGLVSAAPGGRFEPLAHRPH